MGPDTLTPDHPLEAKVTPEQMTRRIGQALKDYCRDSGYTVKEVAKLVGCAPSFIYAVMNGSRIPTLEMVCRIAATVGQHPAELFMTPEVRTHLMNQTASNVQRARHIIDLVWAVRDQMQDLYRQLQVVDEHDAS